MARNAIPFRTQLLFAFLRKVEEKAAHLRGKGYGTETVDREVASALRLLGTAPSLVIDVGANVGIYAATMRRLAPNAEIHMFEPSASCFAKLREAFAGDSLAHVRQVALSDYQGDAKLYADREGSGLASLTRRDLDRLGIEMDHVEAVKVMRLEDYWTSELAGRDVDIVKIDVEGHELSVLRGFGTLLERTRVIQFEFGGTQIDTRQFFKDYFDFFKSAGFRLFRISPLGLEAVETYSEAEECFTTTNYLAARCQA
jgi:FkbM family methyltransferase